MGCSSSLPIAQQRIGFSVDFGPMCTVLPSEERLARNIAGRILRISDCLAALPPERRRLYTLLRFQQEIPHAYRWYCYQVLSGGAELEASFRGLLYQALLTMGPAPEAIDTVIQNDAHRTMPLFPFLGPRSRPGPGMAQMYRILTAYAHLDPMVGYTQGMNFVAALLLTAGLTEDAAFYAFASLMVRGGLRLLYAPGLPLALLMHEVLGTLLQRRSPLLATTFERAAVFPALYSTPWLMTAFVSSPLPTSSALVVLDRLLIEAPLCAIPPVFGEAFQAAGGVLPPVSTPARPGRAISLRAPRLWAVARVHPEIPGSRPPTHAQPSAVTRRRGGATSWLWGLRQEALARRNCLHRQAGGRASVDAVVCVADIPLAFLRAALHLVLVHEQEVLLRAGLPGGGGAASCFGTSAGRPRVQAASVTDQDCDADFIYRALKDEYAPFPWSTAQTGASLADAEVSAAPQLHPGPADYVRSSQAAPLDDAMIHHRGQISGNSSAMPSVAGPAAAALQRLPSAPFLPDAAAAPGGGGWGHYGDCRFHLHPERDMAEYGAAASVRALGAAPSQQLAASASSVLKGGCLHPPRRRAVFVASRGLRVTWPNYSEAAAEDSSLRAATSNAGTGSRIIRRAECSCDTVPCSEWALPTPLAAALQGRRLRIAPLDLLQFAVGAECRRR